MTLAVARNWWIVLLNGLFAIAFGVMAFAWPGVTLLVLVALYGIFCIADGIAAACASFSARGDAGRAWWQMLLVGLASIAAGFLALAWPGITAVALLVIIGVWAIVHGVLEILAAVELRKLIQGEWLLAASGAVSVLFGIFLIARPGAGALAFVWAIGACVILRGVLLVALSLRLRSLNQVRGHTSRPYHAA